MPPLLTIVVVLALVAGLAYLAFRPRRRDRRGDAWGGGDSSGGSEGFAAWSPSDSGASDTFTAAGGDFGGGGASGDWGDSGGGDSGGGDSGGGGDGGGGGGD